MVWLGLVAPVWGAPLDLGSLEWVGCDQGVPLFGSGFIDADTVCATQGGDGTDAAFVYFELANFGTVVDGAPVATFDGVEILVDTGGGLFDTVLPLGDVDINGTTGVAPLGTRMSVRFLLPGLHGVLGFPLLTRPPGDTYGLITFEPAPVSVPESGLLPLLALAVGRTLARRRAHQA